MFYEWKKLWHKNYDKIYCSKQIVMSWRLNVPLLHGDEVVNLSTTSTKSVDGLSDDI